MLARGLDGRDAAVEHDRQTRMRGLEAKHDVVVERRDVAVFARRQAGEPGLARMHDQRVGAGRDDMSRESRQRLLRILVVDADAAFHRHRDRNRGLHRGHAIADQRRLRHQAGAEAALLHPLRRATDVEIDLVIAEIRADPRATGERHGIAAAELERHRMLGRIETDQPVAVAAQHRAGGHHLGIDQRAARQQAMEEPAVPVGPFHHRRYRKPSVYRNPLCHTYFYP